MRIAFSAFLGVFFTMFLARLVDRPQGQPDINGKESVAAILQELGETAPLHQPNFQIKGVSAERGKDLVLSGITTTPDENKETKKQSAHFVCTSCHNIEREDPDLRISDPEARLNYVEKKGLPFLQGSTLYGVVNRSSFYNGDYYKKYGKLVERARNSLREAIQLCAVECAQGRRLRSWEIESVLAYLWTIELKIDDLQLDAAAREQITKALHSEGDKAEAINMIRSSYLQASPATFVTPPDDREKGYPLRGDPVNGKRVYDLGCKHCHEGGRYSFFELDDSQLTFRYLNRHVTKYNRFSIYHVTRYGTPPLYGKKAYMPQYTLERLNNQQLEDLRAYIAHEAKKDND